MSMRITSILLTQKVNPSKKTIKSLLWTWLGCIVLSAILALLSGCATRGFPPSGAILNFDNVDKYVCRGAQENVVGVEFLKSQKVTLVINLVNTNKYWHREGEAVISQGIKYDWVPLNGFTAPSKEKMEYILKLIQDEIASEGKVYIHCEHGCDRTGTVVACYEIRVYHVSNKDAQNDADIHGMSKWEVEMRHFIAKFK